MAEAVAIFGAIGVYREYANVGRDISDIQRHLNNVYYMIDDWRRFWFFDLPTNDELFEAYWGQKGAALIGTQLAAIDRRCEDLAALFSPFVAHSDPNQIPEAEQEKTRTRLQQRAHGKQRGKLQKIRAPALIRRTLSRTVEGKPKNDKQTDLRVLEEHIQNVTSVRKKAKFVLSKASILKDDVQELFRDYEELHNLVKCAWRDQHPQMWLKTAHRKQVRLVGLSDTNVNILREAKEDRQETMVLHDCCSALEKNIRFDIKLMNDGLHKKRFEFFIPWQNPNEHLVVSAQSIPNSSCDEVQSNSRLLEACEAAERHGRSIFLAREGLDRRTSVTRRNVPPVYFDVCATTGILRRGEYELFSLDLKLKHMSIAERVALAYRVTESGLLLFRTPWLASISSKAFHRLKIPGQGPRYILDIKERSGVFHETPQRRIEDLEMCVFMIGIVLVEIALGTAIAKVEPSRSSPAEGLRVVIVTTEGKRERWSLSKVASQVESLMTEDYSDAVQFCLQDPGIASNRTWANEILYDRTRTREEISMALLDLYYEKVLVK